jgi:hypothetical protein
MRSMGGTLSKQFGAGVEQLLRVGAVNVPVAPGEGGRWCYWVRNGQSTNAAVSHARCVSAGLAAAKMPRMSVSYSV